MGWYGNMMRKFLQLPLPLIVIHITAKFLFGFGLGMLLAAYIESTAWIIIGWALIAVSVLLGIPGAIAILRPEKPPAGGQQQP